MWQLTRIEAKNLCSFEHFEYSPTQEQATLIFGNNMDSDSQNSNGSGKSALIEAIAIALIGEPLRKVNNDEIINDRFDEAMVRATLTNSGLGVQMTIARRLSRKNPQEVIVTEQTGEYDTNTTEIPQASVADYNKYILDRLGLTKDDILANFILTARKYKSFLSSSDKEKKEIINRFSNGVLVDESIEALHADMEPVENELREAEKNVAACTGRVEALAAEIERALNEADDRKAKVQSRIENWKRLIAEKREAIRQAKKNIVTIDNSLDALNQLDQDLQDWEGTETSTIEALQQILAAFKSNDLAFTTDYEHEIRRLESTLEMAQKSIAHIGKIVAENQRDLDSAEAEYQRVETLCNGQITADQTAKATVEGEIQGIAKRVRELQARNKELETKRRTLTQSIASLEKQLAGVIECPKCHHEFTLANDIDIPQTREELENARKDAQGVADEIEENNDLYDKGVAEGKACRERETNLSDHIRSRQEVIATAKSDLETIRQQYVKSASSLETEENRLAEAQTSLSRLRKRIFDDAFDVLDQAYKSRENRIKGLDEEVHTLRGSIDSYTKAIEDAQNASDEDLLTSLRTSQQKYQDELTAAVAAKEAVEARLNQFKVQEATFVEFKTYLANTKINAIAAITNGFLEAIGSDIRVALSGYTILKSGKVRDKISVSLLRDGVDCGSFEKFSAGERTRVELASVLAMHNLTNSNCDEFKGLNLLVLDEVLDSTDEDGLACMFQALNKLQLTSLVVSHGACAENYQNRLVVNKANGVSYL